ncbi:MAG: hypothetical protein ACI97A_001214 [Planctomycetota bacterium]|jgi:hypothetical protein
MSKDILGNELTEVEAEILATYQSMKALVSRDDLSPCMVSNLRFATAALAQVVTDLGLEYEHLHEFGL